VSQSCKITANVIKNVVFFCIPEMNVRLGEGEGGEGERSNNDDHLTWRGGTCLLQCCSH